MCGSCRWSPVRWPPRGRVDPHGVEPESQAPYTAAMSRPILASAATLLTLSLALGACGTGSSAPRLANPDPARNPPSTAAAAGVPADGIVTVRPGDTVYAIARRYGIGARQVIEANRLAPPYLLQVGDRLTLPVPRAHLVRAGDTLSEIARAYRVDMRQLAAANDIRPPYAIRVGQRLRLPGHSDGSDGTVVAARAPQSAPSPAPAPVAPAAPGQPWSSDGNLHFPTSRSAVAAAPVGAGLPPVPVPVPRPSSSVTVASAAPPLPPVAASRSVPSPGTAVLTPAPRAGARFLWPVEGQVIAGFGPVAGGLHNDGINIAAAVGTQIRAAENGVVVYAGNELRGFGNLLLIRHADDWTTAYAHADSLLVRRGDRVTRGQPIATVGQSGNVDQPQVHFEIRRGPRPVDPREQLAPARSSAVATPSRSGGAG